MEQRIILVGVDESHVNSREAILSAHSFLRPDTDDKLCLFSVLPRGSEAEKAERRLNEAYKKYASDWEGFLIRNCIKSNVAQIESKVHHLGETSKEDSEAIVEAFLSDAMGWNANLLVLGVGVNLDRASRLGSVVHSLVHNSYRHVLVVKPHPQLPEYEKHPQKRWVFSADGSASSYAGLEDLCRLFLNPQDVLHVVTLSWNHGDRDKEVLAKCQEIVGKSGKIDPKNACIRFVPRQRGADIAEQLCSYAELGGLKDADVPKEVNPFDVLCVASSKYSATVLGSTSEMVISRCSTCVLVLKVEKYDPPKR